MGEAERRGAGAAQPRLRASVVGARYDRATRPYIRLDAMQKRTLGALRGAIERGEIALEHAGCPVCRGDCSDRIASIDRYLLPIHHDLCRTCGFLYSSRRLASGSADHFFNEYYVPLHGGSTRTDDVYFANQRTHGAFVLDFVRPVLRPGLRVAEFGCGPGGILAVLAEQGAAVTGYELNEHFTTARRAGRPPIVHGTIESALAQGLSYDLVVLPHLLNLLFDPLDVLRKVRRLTADGGYVYIEVPGLRAYHEGHYSLCGNPQRHPYGGDLMRGLALPQNFYFDASVMTYLLEQAGFAVTRSTELLRVLAKAVPGEVPDTRSPAQALAGNYATNIEYLKRLEASRQRSAPRNAAIAAVALPARVARHLAAKLFKAFRLRISDARTALLESRAAAPAEGPRRRRRRL